MSVIKPALISENGLEPHRSGTEPKNLELPQKLTILVLFLFNSQLLTYIPIKIGPLTPTMLMEYLIFIVMVPWFKTYDRKLDPCDRYLLFVGFCMFALSLINQGYKGEQQYSIIFNSMYVYFFVVFSFSGHPEYGLWLRRLHLLPLLGIIYRIGSTFLVTYSVTEAFESYVGANQLAIFLAISLPICWVQLHREEGLFRPLNAFVIGCTILAIVVTASRTAVLVFAVVTLLMMITEKANIWMVVLLVLMALFFLLPRQSAFMSRMSALGNPITELSVGRLALWKAAILFIRENPFLGGDFRAEVQRLVLEVAPESNYARHILYGVAGGNFGVHNGYLAVAVYFGVIVAFLYFYYFFSLGKDMYHTRLRIRNIANRRLLTAGLITLVGYAIGNITHHIYIGHNFFTLWAIMQASLHNSLLEEETKVY